MTTKADRVIQALRTHGPSTCVDLEAITGIASEDISSMTREFIRRGKYGLFISGTASSDRGTSRKLLAVNETQYADYMARRAEREATMRPPAPARKHFVIPMGPRSFPRPVTEFVTRWQSSSPYYQEAA